MRDPAIPDLAGQAVLITGASTGIGAALARAFGRQQARVGLQYNSSRNAADEVAAEIRDGSGEVFLVQGDGSGTETVTQIVNDAAAHFGGLDGLINNAGLMLGRVK